MAGKLWRTNVVIRFCCSGSLPQAHSVISCGQVLKRSGTSFGTSLAKNNLFGKLPPIQNSCRSFSKVVLPLTHTMEEVSSTSATSDLQEKVTSSVGADSSDITSATEASTSDGVTTELPTVSEAAVSTSDVPSADVNEGTKPDGVVAESDVKVLPETRLSEEGLPATEVKRNWRKRKCVLMMSYCGQGYLGMQRNPGTKTIEDDVLRALLAKNYIDEESYKKPQLMNFQRAARTDKHVSAARQIVSLKIPDGVDLDGVNKLLPPEIRLMGLKKVTKGFDCKGNCDARTYMYMIPTFAFTPLDQNVVETYRITPEVLENLREALKLYLGTKNFHNFTSRRKPTDPSAMRYIMSFTASDPFVKDGLEYLILRVKGQSFMLHQIRKMIGLIVAYLRGFAGKDTFTKSWSLNRIDIPKAPGVGLVLDHVHYERYNARYGSDGMHEKLTWDEVNEKVENFCQQFIYPIITKCENEEKSMFNWMVTLPYHTYDVREQKGNTPLGINVLSEVGKAAYTVDKDALRAVGVKDKNHDSSDDEDDDDEDAVKPKRQKSEVTGT